MKSLPWVQRRRAYLAGKAVPDKPKVIDIATGYGKFFAARLEAEAARKEGGGRSAEHPGAAKPKNTSAPGLTPPDLPGAA